MRTSKLSKNILTYLSLLAVIGAVALGMFIGKDLYRPSLVSGAGATADSLAGPGTPLPFPILGETSGCIGSQVYTTLPPKCMTMDGRLIQVPGTTSNMFLIPGK